MKLNSTQIQQINHIFNKAEIFLNKPTRTPFFDIGYIKLKNKILLGFHIELYTKQGKIAKSANLEFWVGEVKDFKKETIDLFLEEFEYNESNGINIDDLKLPDIQIFKNKLETLILNI